ncbi:MAG: cation diffusion facilitator family transporter [Treponema sp.]|jgi:cation diffusion facilitator family transporter|nr:cation diffusion facilitator family transporter [Treponema sp.]
MDKAKAGYLEGIVSIGVNSALFAVKLWAGVVTGSIALTADAWHTLSDSVSSIIVVLAVKLASKKADKEHPFGHGRWEQIASLFIAFFLGIIAFEFFSNSLGNFLRRVPAPRFGAAALVVTSASIVIKEALAQYAFYIARKTGGASVKADGWHHRTDALSSLAVLSGMAFARRFWWIDSALGLVIALMLFYATYEIIKEGIAKLLGEEPGQELIDKINAAVKTVYAGDARPHHFHIHNYVVHKELTLHIRLNKDLTIETGHRIATDIETIIQEQFGMIATVHTEPLYPENRA